MTSILNETIKQENSSNQSSILSTLSSSTLFTTASTNNDAGEMIPSLAGFEENTEADEYNTAFQIYRNGNSHMFNSKNRPLLINKNQTDADLDTSSTKVDFDMSGGGSGLEAYRNDKDLFGMIFYILKVVSLIL